MFSSCSNAIGEILTLGLREINPEDLFLRKFWGNPQNQGAGKE